MTITTHTTTNYQFQINITNDIGTPFEEIKTKTFDNALEAVLYYDQICDYGFAAFQREVTLIEPNGKIHQKVFTTADPKFREVVKRYQIQ